MAIRPTQKALAVNFFDFEFPTVTVEIMDWFHAGLLSAVRLDRKSGVTLAVSILKRSAKNPAMRFLLIP